MTELLPYSADLRGIDCHVHSRFSPDAKNAGADAPARIAQAVRDKGLRGFIVTDHIDVGHWREFDPIDFDKYFKTWNRVRADNPDLTIYLGLEVGFEMRTAEQSAELIKDLPLEYVINSVHYWAQGVRDIFSLGRLDAYSVYLDAVLASLDAPYPFTTIGHIGFPERYAPYDKSERAMAYELFKPKLDKIIKTAVSRNIRIEENTNAGGEMRLPRADFLQAYKAAGGARPVIGSDAHVSSSIGQYFDKAEKFLTDIFGE